MGSTVMGEDFGSVGLTPEFLRAAQDLKDNNPDDLAITDSDPVAAAATDAKYVAYQTVLNSLSKGGEINPTALSNADRQAAFAAQRIFQILLDLRRQVEDATGVNA